MTSAHLICKSGHRIKILEKGGSKYSSEAWDINANDAEELLGGYLYFHETKIAPSYFGGKVLSYECIQIEASHSKRIRFIIDADKQCKGVAWVGRNDAMAWYSGIIR